MSVIAGNRATDTVHAAVFVLYWYLFNGSFVLDDPPLLAVVQLLHFTLQVDHLLLPAGKQANVIVSPRLVPAPLLSEAPAGTRSDTLWPPQQ